MLYAAAYYVTVVHLELGAFRCVGVGRFYDYLYFSSVTYTSLGLGDVFPSDHVRIIAGIEALNGLLLIAWSGSFIFIAMGRLWPWDRCSLGQIPTRPIKASGPKD